MSLLRSWLPTPSAASSRQSSQAPSSSRSHPQHSVLPLAASAILSTTQVRPSADPTPQQLLTLSRRAQTLQAHLQGLLDTQAEALAANGQSVSANRQAAPKLSLKRARTGIGSAIHSLASIKREEADLLDVTASRTSAALTQAKGWAEKRDKIRSRTAEIRQNPASDHARKLREEAASVGEEIKTMEMRLTELRARKRTLEQEAAVAENAVQAQASSWAESERLLDVRISKELEWPRGIVQGGEEAQAAKAFWALPKARRTLELYLDALKEEDDLSQSRAESVQIELEALDEGEQVWSRVVENVTAFEQRLSTAVQRLSRSKPPTSQDDPSSLDHLLQDVEGTIATVSKDFDIAQDRSWNLLVCCIGAEVEALQQGREILEILRSSENASESSFRARSSAGTPELDELPNMERTASPDTALVRDDATRQAPESVIRSDATIRAGERGNDSPRPRRREDDPDDDLLVSKSGSDGEDEWADDEHDHGRQHS